MTPPKPAWKLPWKGYLARRLTSLPLLLAYRRSREDRESVPQRRKLPPGGEGPRPGGARRSGLAQDELVPPLGPAGPHGRPLLASVLEEALKPSEAPRSLGPLKVVDAQRSAVRAEQEKRAGPASPRPAQRAAISETDPARWQRDRSPSASGFRGRGSHQPTGQSAEHRDCQCSKTFATRSTPVWNGPTSAERLRTTSLTSGSANN